MIGRWAVAIIGAMALLASSAAPTLACTNITLRTANGDVIRARTMELGGDMESEVLVIPKGTAQVGYGPDGSLDGIKWTANYTAVGLNGFHIDVLIDGINDQGLTGGLLMFPTFAESQTPDPAELDRTLSAEQLVTWALTQFATVDEVKAGLPEVRVIDVALPSVPAFPVHAIFTDRSGKSLVVEYTDGQLQTYDNPIGVLTNSPPFPWHEINLRNFINLSVNDVPPVDLAGIKLAPIGTGGGLVGMPGDYTPPSRFIRATILSQAAPKLETADEMVLEAFHIMNQFDLPPGVIPENPATSSNNEPPETEHTQWTVVMDLSTPRLYISTLQNRGIEMLDLSTIDPGAGVQHIALGKSTAIGELSGS